MPHWPDEAKLHFIGGHSPTAVSHPSLKFLPALLSSLEKGLRDTIFTESFINIDFCNTLILITFLQHKCNITQNYFAKFYVLVPTLVGLQFSINGSKLGSLIYCT